MVFTEIKALMPAVTPLLSLLLSLCPTPPSSHKLNQDHRTEMCCFLFAGGGEVRKLITEPS